MSALASVRGTQARFGRVEAICFECGWQRRYWGRLTRLDRARADISEHRFNAMWNGKHA